MKYTSVFLSASTAISAVKAQDWANVPSCAQDCVSTLIADYTPCNEDDISCVCGYQQTLHENGSDCIVDACGVEEATSE